MDESLEEADAFLDRFDIHVFVGCVHAAELTERECAGRATYGVGRDLLKDSAIRAAEHKVGYYCNVGIDLVECFFVHLIAFAVDIDHRGSLARLQHFDFEVVFLGEFAQFVEAIFALIGWLKS